MTETQRIDVREMAIIHRAFERVYDNAIEQVRAAASPSTNRVAFLAEYIEFGVTMLHHHHEGEDKLLYPLLIERVPEQAAATADVEHEHEQVKQALESVSATCATWRGNPGPSTKGELVQSLEQLAEVLRTHARDEEREVVPLAAEHLTQAEWDAMGNEAVAGIPGKWKPIAFGTILESLSEGDREHMKRLLPTPVRLLFPLLIQRPYSRFKVKLATGS